MLIDHLRFLGKQHRVAIEGNTDLLQRIGAIAGRSVIDQASRDVGFYGCLHVFLGCGQEQVDFKRVQVLGHRLTAGEGGAGYVQVVLVYGIGNPQTGVGRVSRNDDYLGTPHPGIDLVDAEHGLDERKTGTGLEDIVLMLELVLAISFQPLVFVDFVFAAEIEQRS